MVKRKKKRGKERKQKRKLTAEERRRKRERKANYMTIFLNGKQKRVRRPPMICGMEVDEFVEKNADPILLHQLEMWEYMPDFSAGHAPTPRFLADDVFGDDVPADEDFPEGILAEDILAGNALPMVDSCDEDPFAGLYQSADLFPGFPQDESLYESSDESARQRRDDIPF